MLNRRRARTNPCGTAFTKQCWGLQLWKNVHVPALIIAEVWKQAGSSEACPESRVSSVLNYPNRTFENFSAIENAFAGRMLCRPGLKSAHCSQNMRTIHHWILDCATCLQLKLRTFQPFIHLLNMLTTFFGFILKMRRLRWVFTNNLDIFCKIALFLYRNNPMHFIRGYDLHQTWLKIALSIKILFQNVLLEKCFRAMFSNVFYFLMIEQNCKCSMQPFW